MVLAGLSFGFLEKKNSGEKYLGKQGILKKWG
jgi:hypothetical protein